MNITNKLSKRSKFARKWAALFLAGSLLAGCGSGGAGTDLVLTGAGAVAPIVAPIGAALGQLVALPSETIPSAPIPSETIPSRTIPSRETVSNSAVRTFEVTLTADQVLDSQGTGNSVNAVLSLDTGNNNLTLTSLGGSQNSVNISFGAFAGLPPAASQGLSLNTPLTLNANQLASLEEGSASLSLSTAGNLRGQILASGYEVVLMDLQPEQVIETTGIQAASQGSTAIGFFTINTADANAAPPVVLRPVGSFVINDADVNVGNAFAGLNGARQQIALSNAADGNPNDGVWAANIPADTRPPQGIANLGALLAGGYYLDASDGAGRTGNFIRAQITPGDVQVVRMELQPEQVVEENGIRAASAGSTALGFITLDTSDTADTPPVVLRPVGDFVINDADVNVGNAFAGLNGARQQIALSNAADGDPSDGVWAANLPTDTRPPQAIANLQGLLAGGYYIDAFNQGNRSGDSIRAQITPGAIQVVRMELQPEQVVEGTGFSAAPAGSSAVGYFTIDTEDPNDAPAVVLRPVGSFVINDADVNAGGGFAGLNGSARPIALANSADGNPNDGVWAANLPTDTRAPQQIANLGALLAGVYYIDAFDGATRSGNSIRAQITPGAIRVIRTVLQPEQVVETTGIAAAEAGSSAVGFMTLDTSDPNDTPPVVLRPVGSFVINDADVNAGGAFAGSNGNGNRPIALSNAADGDPTDGVWAANLPTDTRAPQSIANLAGLLAGAYNIDASDGAGRTGSFVRGQLTPGGTRAFRAELNVQGQNVGRGFVTITAGNTIVANALLRGVVGQTVTLADSNGVSVLTLNRVAGDLFSSGAPSPLSQLSNILTGVQFLADFSG